MRVDRVSYQKIFPTGMAYLNHKIGIEIMLDADDSPDEAFLMAKETVEQWNKESNPSMGLAMEYFKTDQPPTEIDQKKQDILDILNDPTTILKDLEDGKLITAVMKHGLVKEYNEKKKQLQ